MFAFPWRRGKHALTRSAQAANTLRVRPYLEVLEDRTVPATITVTGAAKFQDGMIGSLTHVAGDNYTAINLRSAIVGADSLSGPDIILLETGTYKLQGDIFGALTVNDASGELTIRNNAGGISTVDAQGLSRVFLNQAILTLYGVKVSGGYAVGQGGGIFNNGVLTLNNSQVVNNFVVGDVFGRGGQGGGVFNNGNAQFFATGTTFANNTAQGGTNAFLGFGGNAEGAGLYLGAGSAFFSNTIDACTFANNQAIGGDGVNFGGGYARGGVAHGGGLFVAAGNHPLTIRNSTFSGNTARGGAGDLSDGGDAQGGGLFLQTGGRANATLANDTIAFNKAFGGAGNGAAGVDGVGSGGGLGSNALASPGLVGYPLAKVINTIVANNSADVAPDVAGPFTSLGHNLIGDVTGASDSFNTFHGDYVGGNGNPLLDPGLDPLGNYGGPTQTHRLKVTSFAIDRGSSSVLAAPLNLTTDQRGNTRKSGLFVDIGAVENIQAAVNKSYALAQNAKLTVTVANSLIAGLKNPEAKTLTVQLIQGPAAGTFVMKTDGTFTYTPPRNFRGVVAVRYRVLADGKEVGIFSAFINVVKTPVKLPGR